MKFLAPVCGAILAAAACVAPTGPSGPAVGARATYDVQIDGKASAFNFAALAYFPNEVKARPGDTIRFTSVDRGEPHTVTFGTMIDELFAAMAKIPKDAPPGPPPPEAQRIPQLLVGQSPNFDLNPAGGQPCFLASGDPPKNAPCPKDQQKQPEFTGTHSYFNSGYLPDRAVFAVRLADTAKPGIYSYLCLFHGPSMSGKLVVVDKADPVPTPEEVKAKGAEQLKKLVEAVKPGVDSFAAKATSTSAVAGPASPDVKNAFSTDFFPKVATVPVGGSVTWQIIVVHTISFNAPPDAIDFVVKAVDGTFHLNAKSFLPANSPEIPLPDPNAPPPPPDAPPPPPLHVDGGRWDGKGFKSSGLLFSFDPRAEVTYKLTFTQPGTYTYKCLVHIDMEGTVKVGQ